MIPKVKKQTFLKGTCRITPYFYRPDQTEKVDECDLMREICILHGVVTPNPWTDDPGITRLLIDTNSDEVKEPEGYLLEIHPGKIHIKAATPENTAYAMQTLAQLIEEAYLREEDYLPCQIIHDWPSYPWRGLHLDVSRHYFRDKTIYQYLDVMRELKLNRFHWHLSDDQGWRIESKKFPLLTEKGAWRKRKNDIYGGFNTQEAIEKIVDYAGIFGIEVIPEIDLPGHAMAMLSAYPELACFPRDFQPLDVWGISEDILCAGKDSTLDFLKELLSEIADLFPGRYFHIGGDEAPKTRWKHCPHCQNRIRKEGLKDEEELQSWLIKELQKTLEAKGKTLIGWDEILDGNIDDRPIVHVWRGDGIDAARKAAQNGNRYIISPNKLLYFDWRAEDKRRAIGAHGVTTLEKVISINPQDYIFGRPELLLGGQANVWTEYINTFMKIKKMIYPRIYAMAEIFWNGRAEADLFERIIIREEIRDEA